jgi:hypothetical protein
MDFDTYRITIKHDNGKVTLTVTASDIKTAIDKVLQAENCPLQAIIKVIKV